MIRVYQTNSFSYSSLKSSKERLNIVKQLNAVLRYYNCSTHEEHLHCGRGNYPPQGFEKNWLRLVIVRRFKTMYRFLV